MRVDSIGEVCGQEHAANGDSTSTGSGRQNETSRAGGRSTDRPLPGRAQRGGREDEREKRSPIQEDPEPRFPIRLPLSCQIAVGGWGAGKVKNIVEKPKISLRSQPWLEWQFSHPEKLLTVGIF
jgi:hypothetical protein